MDKALTQYEPGAVAVEGDHILAVGLEAYLRGRFPVAQVIDCGGEVLMPGPGDADAHVAITLLRGLADDPPGRLAARLYDAGGARLRLARFRAAWHAIGLTRRSAPGSPALPTCTTSRTAWPALCRCGAARRVRPDRAQVPRLAMRDRTRSRWRRPARSWAWKGHPLIVPSVAPHAPFTCTPEILRACAALAAEFDVPLRDRPGRDSPGGGKLPEGKRGAGTIPYVEKHGILDVKVVAAHCVHVDDSEIAACCRCVPGSVTTNARHFPMC